MGERTHHDYLGHDESGVLGRIEYVTIDGRELPLTRRVTSWVGLNDVALGWDEKGPISLIFNNSMFPSPLPGEWWGCAVCEMFHPTRLATCPRATL